MAEFNLKNTMQGISALMAAAALVPNNYDYPVESVTVPCSVVGYPPTFPLGATFGRGADGPVEIPLWVVVGKTASSEARDLLSAFISSATDVYSVLDGAQSFGDVAVTDADISEITIAGVVYLSVKFTVEVV